MENAAACFSSLTIVPGRGSESEFLDHNDILVNAEFIQQKFGLSVYRSLLWTNLAHTVDPGHAERS